MHYAVNNYIYYTKHEPPEQFLLQRKIIVIELLFQMTEIIHLHHLSPSPMLYGPENNRQNAKKDFFSISDPVTIT